VFEWQINNNGDSVRIGNGEAMDTGDPDNDGVMGEDWYNGYDDDGDGLIDEDYFIADGKDNGGIQCTEDSNGDGCFCCSGDLGVDEYIDIEHDRWIDGYDNDGNDTLDVFEGKKDNPEWAYNLEEKNILIVDGRSDSLINGKPNPWYVPNNFSQSSDLLPDLRGDMRYNENLMKYEFDVYIYDYGQDGFPGDPFIDVGGDGELQIGECLKTFGEGVLFPPECDCGLDGLCPEDEGYLVPDIGESNGKWDPGDGWDDDGDGEIENYSFNMKDRYQLPDEHHDVWPLPDGVWNEGEVVERDCGQDELCPEDEGYPGPDPGEGDGILIAKDLDEYDGIYDTGDKVYNYPGDHFDDYGLDKIPGSGDEGEGDKVRQTYESYNDDNKDGIYTPPDYVDNFQRVDDVNPDNQKCHPHLHHQLFGNCLHNLGEYKYHLYYHHYNFHMFA
jgi:hypothetical protein